MNENTGIKSEKDREPMYIRILAKIEKAGNRLPDPVVLFAFLCVLPLKSCLQVDHAAGRLY